MFEVNNRGSDGIGCFRINVRTDGAEGKMFIKRPTFVAEWVLRDACDCLAQCLRYVNAMRLPPVPGGHMSLSMSGEVHSLFILLSVCLSLEIQAAFNPCSLAAHAWSIQHSNYNWNNWNCNLSYSFVVCHLQWPPNLALTNKSEFSISENTTDGGSAVLHALRTGGLVNGHCELCLTKSQQLIDAGIRAQFIMLEDGEALAR